MEQLQEATREQGRTPERRLGDILVEKGFVDEAQIHKLKKLQRDLVVKHRARQAATGRTVPARPLPKARVSEPAPDGNVLKESVSVESRSVAEPPPERPPEPVPVEVTEPVFEELVVAEPEPVVQAEPAPAEPVAASPPQAAAKPASKPAAAPAVAQAPPCVEGDSLELRIVEPSSADVEQLHQLLRDAVVKGASDIHLHSMAPSKARINGQLQEVSPTPMDACEVERLVSASLTPTQREELCHMGELDLCYDVDGVGRFRTNIYRQQRGFDAVYRSIPAEPPTLDELGLPNVLAKHTNYHQGMVLVTGPAGCGKSSTMAALVNLINEERDEHILTIEDPIEYVHASKRCLVNQRHAGRHTSSFARALRGALREDPDVIVIGELRDLETISLAMTAAETGHFVLATLHTSNAVRTISRMIGAFPSNQQGQVRTMLSESLRCVISQRLVVAADGSGRIPVLEMLVINKAIGNLIRDEKTIQIRSAIQTGAAHGMYLLEQSLNDLVRSGQIEKEEALRIAEDKKLITG
ncbi:MAG: type IV pilus twitching motility protein PilT [bacterium]|nr:type IV pilus twitching motility protein PilT [bacterium]